MLSFYVIRAQHSSPPSRLFPWPNRIPYPLSPLLLPTDHRSSTSVVERRSRPCRERPLPAAHYCLKSFSCNTYGSPRKCCKQKTYGLAKPFRCNTYKKHGGSLPFIVPRYNSPIPILELIPFDASSFLFNHLREPILQPLPFHIHAGMVWVYPPPFKTCLHPCAIIGGADCTADKKASWE